MTVSSHAGDSTRRAGPRERDLVRDLARQVREAADRDEMAAIRRRWCDVNALRRPDRAPVWCRPVGAWSEIIPEESLSCSDPCLRELEREFRRDLFKVELGDDTPLWPRFDVGAVFDVDPPNRWGVDIGRHSTGVAGGAWAYDPPLKEVDDFDRLVLPRFTFNREQSQRRAERADDLLGDILPVRLRVGPAYDSATLGSAAADLRGLEQIMVDMLLEPELMHRLMAHVRDARLAELDAMEQAGPLAPNTDGPMLCSDPVGPETAAPALANCWCAGNSQEFDAVSPAMWEEFCLAYQRPIFERFAHACYGCCENLARKVEGVLSIPNLRIFVVSAWTTLDAVLDRVGPQYCLMWRQKAGDVVLPDDVEPIRADLEDGCRKLAGRPYQIVLRELQTLAGHPRRLHDWTRLAIEAAERWA